MSFKKVWTLLKATFAEWEFKQVSMLASSLAYYTVFSLAPLLAIVITIVGAIFGEAAVKRELVLYTQNFIGSAAAQVLETAIANMRQPSISQGLLGLLLNVALLIYGSSKVFVHIQRSLNQIWEVKAQPQQNLLYFISKRILSFAMILVLAFLLLVSFAIDTLLASTINFLSGTIPGLSYLWQILKFLVSFGTITLLFGLIYKILPDAKFAWKDAFVGAALTALLFVFGQSLFALFLSKTDLGSAYGVAGSFVIIITWAYYSAHILLLGAEFTQVYARKRGSPIVPEEHAVRLPESKDAPTDSPSHKSTSNRKINSRNQRKKADNFLSHLRQQGIQLFHRLIRKFQKRR